MDYVRMRSQSRPPAKLQACRAGYAAAIRGPHRLREKPEAIGRNHVGVEKDGPRFSPACGRRWHCSPEITRCANQRVPGAVAFLGHIADKQRLAQIYASCDLFVHSNPKEPFVIGPLEAMASGLPLVAPDHGGVTSYADPGNAYLAAPTAPEFARAVLRTRDEADERMQKIRAARETAEVFSWQAVATAYFSLYETLDRSGTGQLPISDLRPLLFRLWQVPDARQ